MPKDKGIPKEAEESPEEEAAESPEVEAKEDAEGAETAQGAKIPEEFQAKVADLLSSCTLPQLSYLQSEVDDMRSKLMKSQKGAGLNSDSFSDKEMPDLG